LSVWSDAKSKAPRVCRTLLLSAIAHQVQLRFILQEGLDDFQKCFIDSTAVEANTH
jgi:hypothetical protein